MKTASFGALVVVMMSGCAATTPAPTATSPVVPAPAAVSAPPVEVPIAGAASSAGDDSEPPPSEAREAALAGAAEGGIFGSLRALQDGDGSAFGHIDAADQDSLAGLGAPGSMGDAFGTGGLGLTGSGMGGGGTGMGVIGIGSMGTLGHGSGTGVGQVYGSGGRVSPPSGTTPPRVRLGAPSVSGRLPPEVIQRIVRARFGLLRMCYERALRHNPQLHGRVAANFKIAVDGSVGVLGVGGDLPDENVKQCITRAFAGLAFPRPDGGAVSVSYPMSFEPGAPAPPTPTASPSAAPSANPTPSPGSNP